MADTAGTGGPRGHVLIVEDDEATARYLVRVLDRGGYVASAVGDAVAAEVFLEDHASRRRRELTVTIISGRGPASARLIRSQLAAVLPADTRYTVVPDSAPGDLQSADLVVTSPGARVETRRPML